MNFVVLNGIGDTMATHDWLAAVECKLLTDYDGYGHPSDGEFHDPDVFLKPSRPNEVGDAPYVEWYNK